MTAPRTPRLNNRVLPVRSTAGWWLTASCRGADTETFFPPPGDVATVQRALMICDQCPARDLGRTDRRDTRDPHPLGAAAGCTRPVT
jgi:WhiB family redox-sensing transcriptional regulator